LVNFSGSSLIEAADDSGFAPSALGSVHDPVADLVGLPVEGIKQCVRKLRPLSNEPLTTDKQSSPQRAIATASRSASWEAGGSASEPLQGKATSAAVEPQEQARQGMP
jgi:hypothetical protein